MNRDDNLVFDAEKGITFLAWFIQSGARTLDEVKEDSNDWGNYCKIRNSSKEIKATGSNEAWCTNNIYDFAGNVDEWTQEQNSTKYHVCRGGSFVANGKGYPAACRELGEFDYFYKTTGFRIALWLK